MAIEQLKNPWIKQIKPSSDRAVELLSIQYLRAGAAIAVLAFHAAQRGGTSFGAGAAGVDVFFVISGFIMWVIGARATPASFLARRAARIVPLYWLVTLVVAGAAIAMPSVFPNLRPTVDHVVKSMLFYPHADPSGAVAPLIVPGWTLDYEVFFYLVFAVSLFAAARSRVLVLTAVLGSLVLMGHFIGPTNPALVTYTHPLLLEFLSGVWLGKAWAVGIRLRSTIGAASMALGIALMAIVAALGIDVEPVRIFVWGVPAFLIVAGALALEPVRDWPIVKFLGDASYSIYLVHGLAIAFCARVLAALDVDSLPIFLCVSIGGGITAGCGCYLLVEKPLLRLFHPYRRKHITRREAAPVLAEIAAVASRPDTA